MTKAKHVLGISGGKDSAALSIYLHDKYPELDIEYYFTDTGKELDETYTVIERLESHLGKKVLKLKAKEAEQNSSSDPFDHFYKMYRGYLPSSNARWCTKKLKLEPFEEYIGEYPTISYVGIRGDEDREGYISKRNNIQSIFPFRRNIWSEDVVQKMLHESNTQQIGDLYSSILKGRKLDKVASIILEPNLSEGVAKRKLDELLTVGIVEFNKVAFDFLKSTKYPLASEIYFPLIENDDVLNREDIFRILRESNVGVPEYYEKIKFEVDGKEGEYARSRSGCYFCFFQQKIEWVWLMENHPDLFKKAIKYENEKAGFTWNQNESLRDLSDPRRVDQIKREFLSRKNREKSAKSPYLMDILDDTESNSCIACFV